MVEMLEMSVEDYRRIRSTIIDLEKLLKESIFIQDPLNCYTSDELKNKKQLLTYTKDEFRAELCNTMKRTRKCKLIFIKGSKKIEETLELIKNIDIIDRNVRHIRETLKYIPNEYSELRTSYLLLLDRLKEKCAVLHFEIISAEPIDYMTNIDMIVNKLNRVL